ncbi:MAG TPA: carboxylating nicotinate-nucleotide diphosphorylase [Hadesarchaea archaeon]|nr:carboxylating nicotinate-nucleotide diphosphorylase [Hadesarchaea archaeon]
MLAEDIGSGDVTTEILVSPKLKIHAEIVAGQGGVVAGVKEALEVFRQMGVKGKVLKSDGEHVREGDVIITLTGPARSILSSERVALNLMMRMSGIATATKKLIDLARRRNSKVKIAATRKTAPLLTYFDKRAVMVVGGEPHRYKLSDHILIKDNHLWIVGSVSEAVSRARAMKRGVKIEVEVSTPQEALDAARAGADIIMLDNMKPAEVRHVVKLLEREGLRDKVLLEASGGIDTSNVGDFAAAGVDVISSSYMTIRAPALDMSLEIKRKR